MIAIIPFGLLDNVISFGIGVLQSRRFRCRHTAFAKYFGDDDIRPCSTSCDYCVNPKAVDKALAALDSNSLRAAATSRKRSGKFDDDDCELYEGGKRAYK